jgi:hypothetical protein
VRFGKKRLPIRLGGEARETAPEQFLATHTKWASRWEEAVQKLD